MHQEWEPCQRVRRAKSMIQESKEELGKKNLLQNK